jgi:hypothetical protein
LVSEEVALRAVVRVDTRCRVTCGHGIQKPSIQKLEKGCTGEVFPADASGRREEWLNKIKLAECENWGHKD